MGTTSGALIRARQDRQPLGLRLANLLRAACTLACGNRSGPQTSRAPISRLALAKGMENPGHNVLGLYVKRVFVMGDCDQLLPRYLRFVKGVVDAKDLSLNVSREILQQDRQIKAIHRRLTKKVISTIKDLQSERPEDYRTFWTQFGRTLKEGLMSDFDNKDTLLRISSFASTHSDEEPITLNEYVERMKDGQEQIFYASGESREQLLKSPHLEAFKAKGYEVLLLTDPVDEIWVGSVTEFDGKPLQSVAKGEVDLDSEDEKKRGRARGAAEGFRRPADLVEGDLK
jgi:molecular chaperone HtpG